jgi:hypothetical protein
MDSWKQERQIAEDTKREESKAILYLELGMIKRHMLFTRDPRYCSNPGLYILN